MKTKINIILSLAILVVLGVSCEPSEVIYSDKEYVMFEDSVLVYPVVENDTIYNVHVSSTVTCDYDRNYAVQILDKKSNAIEGYHYTLMSPNLTIKKGELTSSIQLKSNYKNFKSRDSLCVTLQLLAPKSQKLDLYKDEVNVQLLKCPPLDLDVFTTNVEFFASFPFSEDTQRFFLKTEKVNEHRLLLKDPFDSHHDLYVDFDYSDILYPTIEVPEQVAFTDAIYGEIYAKTSSINPSWFYPGKDDRMIVMYLEFYIPSVGRLGTYQYIIRWVDESTVEDSKNEIN